MTLVTLLNKHKEFEIDKPTDRTKTTPEIHQQIKIQAAQAKMKIAPYIKMLLDNDKEKTINFNCNNYQEVIELLNTIDEKVTIIINVDSIGKQNDKR